MLVFGAGASVARVSGAAGGLRAALSARPDLVLGPLVPVVGLGIPLVVASVALGRRSAHRWFRLVCPQCGTVATRGPDVLLRKVKCLACGEEF